MGAVSFMSPEVIIAIIGVAIVIITIIFIVLKFTWRRAPLKPRKKTYTAKWQELQQYCKHRETWPKAVEEADRLLDKAMIKRGFKGKSTGERLVSAQRALTDNDAVWYAHKLCKKLREDPGVKLKEKEVKEALVGFRQALKDLGAL